MEDRSVISETNLTTPASPASGTSDAARDYRYVLAALAGLIVAYFLWQYVVEPKEIYLSDLPYQVEPGFDWKVPQNDTSIDGNPLQIGNTVYSKGIGTHANVEITVEVPAGARYFRAEVGVDAEMEAVAPSSVKFLVYGNGVLLADTEIIRAGELPHQLSVDVEGYDLLKLRSDDAGDGNHSDHADWANARFVR